MKSKILILGAGRMVQAIAFDLAPDFDLTISDINQKALKKLEQKFGVKTLLLNVADKDALVKAVMPFDLVIGAVPGQYGFEMLKTVIEAGKKIVDISFAPEDAIDLNALAIKNNALAIVDIGVAPGLSNLILGHHSTNMKIESFTCMVGGLPEKRELPFEYKAPFSPIDVIEEYIRPARIMRNGKIETVMALTEPELVNIESIGELEGFVTDGLRSLLYTISVPNMMEKTLRYPGHRRLMEVFRETGFFNTETIEVNGEPIRPVDVTSKLLLPKWKLEENEKEFTAMTIAIEGQENGKHKTYNYLLIDRFDEKTGLSSMARTTGLTCASAARMVLKGLFNEVGVYPPELVGKKVACYDYIMGQLSQYSITFKQR